MNLAKKFIGNIFAKTGLSALGGGEKKASPRAMRYPYTFTAKIVQFPYMHYFKHSWMYRYYSYALIISLPIFWKIQCKANSPENVAKWEEQKRKDHEKDEAAAAAHDH
ncbi:hypothetical protein RI129_005821 [Pyrocoelia pectoralis]|uniref:Uncharacterized protein n=1 Tax=Pyrocoelia pectoralis TaxID=417401 RepID=A0AAN7VG62_9COLE